jgi:hypothetical protein
VVDLDDRLARLESAGALSRGAVDGGAVCAAQDYLPDFGTKTGSSWSRYGPVQPRALWVNLR